MAVSARDVSAGNSARSAFEKACTSSWCSPDQARCRRAGAGRASPACPSLPRRPAGQRERRLERGRRSCSRTASAPGSRGCTSPVSSTSVAGAARRRARHAASGAGGHRRRRWSGRDQPARRSAGRRPASRARASDRPRGSPAAARSSPSSTQALMVRAPTALAASSRRWSSVLSVPLSVCTTRIGGGSVPSRIHRA